MPNNILKNFSSELARGSIFLLAGTLIFNILNYIFHFSMARMLGPSDYGVLASLFAIIYIFAIPSETIQMTVARYAAIFNTRKEGGKIKSLIKRVLKKSWVFGGCGIIIFLIISPFIKNFLNFSSILPLIVLSLLILPTLILPIVRGVLQGVKKFKILGLNMTIEGILKLILAVFLVFLGFNAAGAIFAVIIAGFIAFLCAFYFLKKTIKDKEKYFESKEIYYYSIPVFIAIICITLMYSIDVILAKHIFSEYEAGIYAVASLLGKMIFFALSPIAKVMFPIVTEKKESKKEYENILKKTMLAVGAVSAFALLVYYLFPQLIVEILFGKQYLDASGVIFYLGAAFTFILFSYIIIFYNLSLGKKKFVVILPFFAIFEIILLSLFNKSLMQFSIVLMAVNFITFLTLIFLSKKQR